MEIHSEKELCSEIGRFVVEFEALLLITKETIETFFPKLEDTVPIEILMYDSTSASISKYYQAIALHNLYKKHDKNNSEVKKAKKFISEISAKLIQAGELRNDIVHATWFLSSMYGDSQLNAKRIKITADGREVRKLEIIPGILDEAISMINELAYLVSLGGEILMATNTNFTFKVLKRDLDDLAKINFDKQRKKLFTVTDDFRPHFGI